MLVCKKTVAMIINTFDTLRPRRRIFRFDNFIKTKYSSNRIATQREYRSERERERDVHCLIYLPLLRRPSGPSDPTGSGSGGFNPVPAWGLTAPCGSGACSGQRERERERERETQYYILSICVTVLALSTL
eukprot:sb/3475024/